MIIRSCSWHSRSGYGVPEASIATAIGIDAKTLRCRYREELTHGHTKANAKIADYSRATSARFNRA